MSEVEGQVRLGERKLTTIHAIGQSLAIGPMFSAGVLTGLIASVAGFSTPLSVLLGAIGAVCLGYVISLFARRYSGAGRDLRVPGPRRAPQRRRVRRRPLRGRRPVPRRRRRVHRQWIPRQQLLPDTSRSTSPGGSAGLAVLLIATGLNYLGVRVAMRGVLALSAFSLIPFLILAITIIAKGGSAGNTLAVFGTSHSSVSGVFHGILFAVTLFIGFEAAASIGEEAQGAS